MVKLLCLLAVLAGCEKTFYCEDTPDHDGVRYCYKAAADCGAMGKDVLTDKPRDVKCVERHDVSCRPDPNFDRVCTWTKGECEASIPRGLEDTRTGRPPPCEWER